MKMITHVYISDKSNTKTKVKKVYKDTPKWIETTLAVDSSVIKFHGRDEVLRYVLTLMNIVGYFDFVNNEYLIECIVTNKYTSKHLGSIITQTQVIMNQKSLEF